MVSKIDGTLPRDLGNGLILRQATPADTEPLAAFNGLNHRDRDTVDPDEGVIYWTRDLMRGNHPTFAVEDFTVVEDTQTGAIVSSLNLIDQVWSYEGIEFKVGRPELVSTHPDYRKRGLIRAQFDLIHRWSAERGQKLQAITGIPYYYRQFGYEMTMTLSGARTGYCSKHVPKLKDGETEPFRVRSAVEADIPFIADLYNESIHRYLVACCWDEAMWRYELNGRNARNIHARQWNVIESAAGQPVGYLAHTTSVFYSLMIATAYELKAGVSWLAVTPAIVRYLAAIGSDYAARDKKECAGFSFNLGEKHPVYEAIQNRLPDVRSPYAWYIRIPDLPDFLRLITPVLNDRLAKSIAVGYTGDLKLSFYRDGLRLVFETGCLVRVEPWTATLHQDSGAAAFPGQSFLQVLFGYRSLDELHAAFPDFWVETDEARVLLNAMFPRQPSHVSALA